MKRRYIFRYVWHDLWHSSNRPFTLINLIAIGISTAVLVLLAGAFFAFKENGEKMMDKLGLSLEVTSHEEKNISDELRQKISQLPGVSSTAWWTPTIFLFYDKQGRLYDGIGGRTIDMEDPLMETFQDFRSKSAIRFKSKKELNTPYNELGIIVPFVIMKQLGYLPAAASPDKPETWQNIAFPSHLQIMAREDKLTSIPLIVSLPLLGILPESENGRYFVTKDCYTIFGYTWRNEFRPYLWDRNKNPLFPGSNPEPGMTNPLEKELPFPPPSHVTLYAMNRNTLLPLLHHVRSLGLKADCVLEDYLKDYQQQEIFFMASAGGICLVMFFFSGVILFSTFQALILRKLKEIGILKACGSSQFLVYRIFLFEAALISTMSTLFGSGLGAWAGVQMSCFIQKEFIMPDIVWYNLPPLFLAIVFIFGIVFCLLVTFFPVRMAVKSDADILIRS